MVVEVLILVLCAKGHLEVLPHKIDFENCYRFEKEIIMIRMSGLNNIFESKHLNLSFKLSDVPIYH